MNNLLIEGANATGKTTAMNTIRDLYPKSTFIEFHDFYHEHVINQFGLKELHLSEHWAALTDTQRNEIECYQRNRNDGIFSFLKLQPYNKTIIERLIITQAVYSELLLKKDISDYFLRCEENLVSNNITVVLITCEEKILRDTLEVNIRTRKDRNLEDTQFHLKSVDVGVRKNELYRTYFNKLNSVKKVMINNRGNSVDEFKNEVVEVISKL